MARTRSRHHSNQQSRTGAGISNGKSSDEHNDSDSRSNQLKGSVVDTAVNERLQGDEEISLSDGDFSSKRGICSQSDSEKNGNYHSSTQDDSSSSNDVAKRKPRSRDSLAFEALSQSHATSVWSTGTNRILSQLLRPSQLSSNSENSRHCKFSCNFAHRVLVWRGRS